MTQDFRAVVFDLFITLTDFDAERQRPRMQADLARVLGVDPDAFRKLLRDSFTERATGQLGDLAATLAILCQRLGHEPTDEMLENGVALRLLHERELLSPRAGVLEMLGRLRDAGYRLGVVTDCTAELPVLWSSLPFAELVDAVVMSCEVERRKPDPHMYEVVCHRLDVASPECVYVGDGGSRELSGATRAGMTAVRLATPFPQSVRYDAESWEGPTIGDLNELWSIL